MLEKGVEMFFQLSLEASISGNKHLRINFGCILCPLLTLAMTRLIT